jgi:D-amino-acid dehydrogenase
VLVIGAGVVGMACARALQRDGFAVCVVDPEPPGSVCSYGNAGVVATDHVLPLARPEVLRRVPRMLLARDGPLYLKAARVPALLPWLARFAAACRPARVACGIRAMAALTGAALPAWERELEASDARDLLTVRGMYTVYRSDAAFHADAAERGIARELGVAWECLGGAELRRREPALAPELRHGVYYPGVAHVRDPAGLVRRLAAAFQRDGGALLENRVMRLSAAPHQVTAQLERGRLRCRYAVVAAGLGSGALCAGLGWRPPLIAEMGYHLTLPGAESRLSAPVAATEDGFIATPMADHLRLAGTVEFAAREAPPTWRRADMLHRLAAGVFREMLPAAGARWRGSRPSLPDFLPAIGPLPGQPRVLAAFGHQHVGLTTAAVTGTLICELVGGRRGELDPAPYAPLRFAAATRSRPSVLAR